jgi:hypothetical protein
MTDDKMTNDRYEQPARDFVICHLLFVIHPAEPYANPGGFRFTNPDAI